MPRKNADRDDEQGLYDEGPYLRRQGSIEVKRKQLETGKLKTFLRTFFAVVLLAAVGVGVRRIYDFATTSPRFAINIGEIRGLQNLSENVVLEQLKPLLGQNIFRANYSDSIHALMEIPWIKSVEILRLWPSTLSVVITERQPVGFALINDTVRLIDRDGVPLATSGDTPPKFDFPIMRGLTPENTTDDHLINQIRIGRYMDLLSDLDKDQGGYSKDISEVEVSDPDDVKALLKDDPIVIQFGKSDYQERFKLYLSNIKRLKQEYPHIDSVDLRFKDRIIIKPADAAPAVKGKS
ncbi:MAG: FtsQ-type POTRA domain-containing protein [Acidobacteriia bacterium]|nr:FtsQ-type POTRA domain-containing protein [Terriglobia bacterium]